MPMSTCVDEGHLLVTRLKRVTSNRSIIPFLEEIVVEDLKERRRRCEDEYHHPVKPHFLLLKCFILFDVDRGDEEHEDNGALESN